MPEEIQEYTNHRQQLFEHMEPGSIAIIGSGKLHSKSNDLEFPFVQNKDFLYLTGYPEPSSVACLIKNLEGKTKYILFNQEKVKKN